jgi:hypothetical protein
MTWVSGTVSVATWTLDSLSRIMPWKTVSVSAVSADNGQDFQYAFREIGALVFSTGEPFLLTDSTLSEGLP